MVAPRKGHDPAEQEARRRFVALLNVLELHAAERAKELARWQSEAQSHLRLMRAAVWATLAMLTCAVLIPHWITWTCVGLVLAWIGVVVLCKRGEHAAERMAHECRMTQFERRREAILRGDF